MSLTTDFAGTRGPLFRMALVTSIWTILTLGFYRFWMKTRLRRYYWSSIRPGGLPLEYVGDPMEKLLGFFMVVVLMAFYIGVVNLVLMFISLSLLGSNFSAYAASFVGVIPLLFYARYRARRYVLARTRWRGVRFGLQPGAWGYAGRALWHWALTILTLGLLWPRKTFYLEKFKTDRTVFGSARLTQGGTWTMLYPAFVHVLVAGALTAGATVEVILGQPQMAWFYVFTLPWLAYGLVHYSVESKRLLTNHKSAGEVQLNAAPRIGTVIRIYVFGYLATFISILLPMLPILAIIGAVEGQRFQAQFDPDQNAGEVFGLPLFFWTILGIVAYFAIFLTWSVVRHTFVTMPLWRHYAETLSIQNPGALKTISQKERDEFREAEGFAEALDLWGAI